MNAWGIRPPAGGRNPSLSFTGDSPACKARYQVLSSRASLLDAFKAYLHERFNAGHTEPPHSPPRCAALPPCAPS